MKFTTRALTSKLRPNTQNSIRLMAHIVLGTLRRTSVPFTHHHHGDGGMGAPPICLVHPPPPALRGEAPIAKTKKGD